MNKIGAVAFVWASVVAFAAASATAAKPPTRAATFLGRLSQTLHPTPVRAHADVKSRVYYKAHAHEYLVVRTSPNCRWYRVLLADGDFGYVPASSVEVLPKQVWWNAHGSRAGGHGKPESGRVQRRVAAAAASFVGTPYHAGGDDPKRGFDSAGFVCYLWRAAGAKLPRNLHAQMKVGRPVYRLEDLVQGDRLYFWSDKAEAITEVGIFRGAGYFTYCSRGQGVRTEYLGKKWREALVAARR